MGTGTLELADVERHRREAGELDSDTHANLIVQEVLAAAEDGAATRAHDLDASSADGEAAAVARGIVEDVLAAEAAADSEVRVPKPSRAPRSESRPHLVMLDEEESLVLVPGPVYDPGSSPWTPSTDRLAVLVEQAIDSVRTAPRSARELVQGIADAADMTRTRWMVLALVWMVAFAGLMPLAFASIGSSVDLEIEIFEDEAPAVQEQPADTSSSNPSVEGSGS